MGSSLENVLRRAGVQMAALIEAQLEPREHSLRTMMRFVSRLMSKGVPRLD